jgi:hypothetical protein
MPGAFSRGWYLDLDAAFWRIMEVVGWNLNYYPGKWLARGRPPYDFPWKNNKVARTALVSNVQGTPVRRYDPTRGMHVRQMKNPLLNRGISCLIYDVLNSLAEIAIGYGARYINVDGWIFTSEDARDRMIQAAADYGLTTHLKAQGPGTISGIGRVRIGYVPKPEKIPESTGSLDHVKRVPYRSWLQERFSAFAASRETFAKLDAWRDDFTERVPDRPESFRLKVLTK